MQQQSQYVVNKIAIGCDHAGVVLKELLRNFLTDELKLQVIDCGWNSQDKVDYPDFAAKVSFEVLQDTNNNIFGVVVCGSGIGISQSCNKAPGIRAAVCHDFYTAETARQKLNCNVISFGDRIIGSEVAKQALKSFLQTKFIDSEENKQFLIKLEQLEKENLYQNQSNQPVQQQK